MCTGSRGSGWRAGPGSAVPAAPGDAAEGGGAWTAGPVGPARPGQRALRLSPRPRARAAESPGSGWRLVAGGGPCLSPEPVTLPWPPLSWAGLSPSRPWEKLWGLSHHSLAMLSNTPRVPSTGEQQPGSCGMPVGPGDRGSGRVSPPGLGAGQCRVSASQRIVWAFEMFSGAASRSSRFLT